MSDHPEDRLPGRLGADGVRYLTTQEYMSCIRTAYLLARDTHDVDRYVRAYKLALQRTQVEGDALTCALRSLLDLARIAYFAAPPGSEEKRCLCTALTLIAEREGTMTFVPYTRCVVVDGPIPLAVPYPSTDAVTAEEYVGVVTDAQRYHKDAGKPDYTLIPSHALGVVLNNFEEGIRKGYEARSWRKVPNAPERYLRSLLRHAQKLLEAYQEEGVEGLRAPDDGADNEDVTHLGAVAADALILIDLLTEPEEE